MPELQEIWRKLNANERLASSGALVVVVAWLLGLVVAFGAGFAFLELLAAVALLLVYYLKYSPARSVSWPAPVATVAVLIAAAAALIALLGVIGALGGYGMVGMMRAYGFEGYGPGGYSVGYLLVALAIAAGAGMMALGTWREYQAASKTPSA